MNILSDILSTVHLSINEIKELQSEYNNLENTSHFGPVFLAI